MAEFTVHCPENNPVVFSYNKRDSTVNGMCAVCNGIVSLKLNNGKPTGGSGLCRGRTPPERFTIPPSASAANPPEKKVAD